MKVIALVPAAGSGVRMGGGDDKPFLELRGKPILAHTLSRLAGMRDIDAVVVIVKDKYIEKAKEIIASCGIDKVTDVIAGGDSRTESVANGINSIDAASDDIVLVHDGVRPFVTEPIVTASIEAAKENGAAVVGIPCTATIKEADSDGFIKKTPDRNALWEAQTPQAFRFGILKESYRKFAGEEATDDSCFVEDAGHKVSMVEGERRNIKVTIPADLAIAEAILDAGEEV